MNNIESKIFLQTRLRNLKRKYAKLIQDPVFTEDCIDLKAEIDSVQQQLNALN